MKLVYVILAIFSLNTFFLQAETMQKRQYRKRHHKIQINASSLRFGRSFDVSGLVDVGYAYNSGYFEIGGILGLNPDFNLWNIASEYEDINVFAGLSFEGNFIRNKRRNHWIPSIGLKVYGLYDRSFNIFVSPFLSSKHFVSSRTSINVEVSFPLKVWDWNLDDLYDGFGLSVGYAYYFH